MRDQNKEFEQRDGIWGTAFQQDRAVGVDQDEHGILAEHREQGLGKAGFRIADRRYEEPECEHEAHDLAEVAEEDAECGQKPTDSQRD